MLKFKNFLLLFVIFLLTVQLTFAKTEKTPEQLFPNDVKIYFNLKINKNSELSKKTLEIVSDFYKGQFDLKDPKEKTIFDLIINNFLGNSITIALNGNLNNFETTNIYSAAKINSSDFSKLVFLLKNEDQTIELNSYDFPVYTNTYKNTFITKIDDYIYMTNNETGIKKIMQLYKNKSLGFNQNIEFQNAISKLNPQNPIATIYFTNEGYKYALNWLEEESFSALPANLIELTEATKSYTLILDEIGSRIYEISSQMELNSTKANQSDIRLDKAVAPITLYKILPSKYLSLYFETHDLKEQLSLISDLPEINNFNLEIDQMIENLSQELNLEKSVISEVVDVFKNLNQNLAFTIHSNAKEIYPEITFIAKLSSTYKNQISNNIEAIKNTATEYLDGLQASGFINYECNYIKNNEDAYFDLKLTIISTEQVLNFTFGLVDGNLVLSNYANIADEIKNGQSNLADDKDFTMRINTSKDSAGKFYLNFENTVEYLNALKTFLENSYYFDAVELQTFIDILKNISFITMNNSAEKYQTTSKIRFEFKDQGLINIIDQIKEFYESQMEKWNDYNYETYEDSTDTSSVYINEAIPQSKSILLIWESAYDDSEITGYKIYYGQNPTEYENIKEVGNQNSTRITGLETGKTYYFAIKTIDNAGNESEGYSLEVSAIPY
ncbi:hypothetical protein A2335_02225 [Candidatus Peregrinibacteria bacterium RIFOXYB2_FULL_32_7]|nr:MAG: hypothetical protein A2335_02225 [Candidatus Peregrinibacteria bacterium RIFOXYB2_FULL_32_7]